MPKTYEAQVAGRVSSAELAQLRSGIWLAEGKVRASRVRRLGARGASTLLEIVLREGRNREVRRMFARLGHKVMRLQRTAMGPVKIRRLKPGQSRPATEDEIRLLREAAVGGDRRAATPTGQSKPLAKSVLRKRPRSKRSH